MFAKFLFYILWELVSIQQGTQDCRKLDWLIFKMKCDIKLSILMHWSQTKPIFTLVLHYAASSESRGHRQYQCHNKDITFSTSLLPLIWSFVFIYFYTHRLLTCLFSQTELDMVQETSEWLFTPVQNIYGKIARYKFCVNFLCATRFCSSVILSWLTIE